MAHIHATSIRAPSSHAGHKNAAARRSVLPTRPPTAAPLSLKPDGHFQPLWWLNLAGPGGHWLGIDVHSTGTVCGAIEDATGTHGELWYTREVTAML